jgi:RHS repeat-associated protein
LKDNEVYGSSNAYDYGQRMYDPRLGRFMSVDPIEGKYPMLSPYQFASDNPIADVDIDGLEGKPLKIGKVLAQLEVLTDRQIKEKLDARKASATTGLSNDFLVAMVQEEGIALTTYDKDGNIKYGGDATIGIGHLIHLGAIGSTQYDQAAIDEEKPYQDGLTLDQAFDLFVKDVSNRLSDIRSFLALLLNNKMKKVLLLLIVALFNLFGNAQSIQWGLPQKPNTNSKPSKIIGEDSKGAYLIKFYNSHQNNTVYPSILTLEKFDFPDMKREFSKELRVTENGEPKGPAMYFDSIFNMKDNLVLMLYGHDVKTLYGMKINPDGSLGDKTEIGTVRNKWNGEILADARYKFQPSRDRMALVGYYADPKQKNKMTLKALDENVKELWSKDLDGVFNGKKDIEPIAIHSTDGNIVFVLVDLGSQKDVEDYGMLVYNHQTNSVSEYNVEIGDNKTPFLIDFNVDNSNEAIIAGYYGDEKSKETVIGTYTIRLDASGKVILKNSKAFDKDFMEHVVSNGKAERGKGIDQLALNNIIVLDDKSVIIPGQQSNAYTFFGGRTKYPMRVTLTPDEYDCYDIIVSYVKPDGSVSWTKSVAQKAGCLDLEIAPKICTFSLFVGSDKVYVFFNAAEKNSKINTQAVLDGDNSDLSMKQVDIIGTAPVMMMESIDITSGQVNRALAPNQTESKLVYYTEGDYQPNNNTAIIYKGDKGKNDQLGILTLK